ncbi:(d)CMP kinase [Candidatus Dependentiae bacterium]
MIITIDGPVGSGKSSVAKNLAKKLNIYYLNTGLLYRSVAYILINVLDRKLSDLENITQNDLEFTSKIVYRYFNNKEQILFDGKDITKDLYQTALDQAASIISAKKIVRQNLLDLQRSIAKENDLVAEGRDCGTVVFVDADYKFFLTASIKIRAMRILTDEKRINQNMDLGKVEVEVELRDKRDRERDISPLAVPDNAIIIDNSKMDERETVKEFLRFIKR